MSFFSGNTLGATSTPAKSGGLFSSFGTTPGFGAQPATSAAPAFGATSTFGSTNFGAPAASTAPTLGGFGSFGTQTATSTAPALGGFGGFGTQATATSSAPQTLFGTGAQTAATNTGGFGIGTAAPSFGGFGTNAANTATGGFSGFGSTAVTSTAPTFGGFNAQTGFGGFNSGVTGFGKQPTATPMSGFGNFTGTTSLMASQPQQQPIQITPDEAFAQSIFNVSIYGDERDTIIAKWNYLQAMWGTGKSFYSQNAYSPTVGGAFGGFGSQATATNQKSVPPILYGTGAQNAARNTGGFGGFGIATPVPSFGAPVMITPDNYLCRFKALGYSRLPGKDNKMGLVAINLNKPLIEVKPQQHQIISTVHSVIGNKPNLLINIETIKEHEEKKSQVVIYITEESQFVPNERKRILATDLANYLNQANVKPKLASIGVYEVLALVLPDEDQLKEYLENPPKGIDPRMWRQAKLDNPDPTKFIPVPMIGFNDLKCRIKCQEQETETHALYLQKVGRDLAELRQRHSAATAKIMEYKRNLAELSHKILKIIVKQECTRKVGLALTPEEEALRSKLENMQALVSAPTQFKGRLSELLSQMRMQRNQYSLTTGSEYAIDKDSEDEMKTFLAMQQKAMEVLTDTVTKDLKALQIIMAGMPELVRV